MKRIGTPFIQLNEVESTNNYAMAQAQALMAEHGTTWFAWYQSKGKGQRGRKWEAEPGLNIMQSTIVTPTTVSTTNQFYLSIAMALGCYDFFSNYAGDETSIKWPNDIYWRDRKAGGMLIENILQGQEWKFAIVGIGININQVKFHPELQNPVSLKQITGKTFDILEMSVHLCEQLEKRWQQLSSMQFDLLLDEYNKHLFKCNERVKFKAANAIFEATVKGANAAGELIVDTGTLTTLPYGSVEWLLSK